ncbi:MAG: ATP-dependent helicase [bacterium]
MKNVLNVQQQEAVEYINGPLMVLAGAGSGKTRVITTKIIHLIQSGQVAGGKIAAITFTNKAAKEMQARLKKMLGKDQEMPIVSTFHSLGLRILRTEKKKLGFSNNLSVFDVSDTQRLMREILPKNIQKEEIDMALSRISKIKNKGISPEQAAELSDQIPAAIAEIYEQYQQRLTKLSAVDFDDLIYLPLQLFNKYEDVRLAWSERIRYLMVDEYQDTNTAQYELMRYLAGDRGQLTVVGDDDQSIYAWRGANSNNIEILKADYPKLRVIKLEQNYRSRGTILKAANAVVANNPHDIEKKLWSALGDGPPIMISRHDNPVIEARSVCSTIMTIRFKENCPYDKFAIVYRSNHQARDLEQVLREQRIPYHLSGGLSFFDRSEIKDVLSYCRVLANPDDDISLMRIINVPKREVGSGTLAVLREIATHFDCSLWDALSRVEGQARMRASAVRKLMAFKNWMLVLQEDMDMQPIQKVTKLLHKSGYLEWLKVDEKDPIKSRRKIKNVEELLRWIERACEENPKADFAEILNILALGNNEQDEPGEVVRLMTIHASKGLEFKYVFLVGAEEGILPHQNALDEGSEEEERRLMYVAMTRAEEALHISHVKKRKKYGEMLRCKSSRFIEEIPTELTHNQSAAKQTISKSTGKAHLAELLKMTQE